MKTVLITGASGGLGASIARFFAKNNYNVVLSYNHSYNEIMLLKQELEGYNVDVLSIKCDITDELQIKDMVSSVIKKFKKIDVLVNNAGIAIDTTFDDKTKDNFFRILDTNLVGPFLLCKYIGNFMSNGVIINISSTNGIDTYYEYSLDYDASKAGLISLTHNLALHFAPNIRVNAVCPGWINTDMNKNMDVDFKKNEESKIFLGRFAYPEEIASVVFFLATDEARYINNEVIRVDGGTYHA